MNRQRTLIAPWAILAVVLLVAGCNVTDDIATAGEPCDEEGAVEGELVCEDGTWVHRDRDAGVDPNDDVADGSDTGEPEDAEDTGNPEDAEDTGEPDDAGDAGDVGDAGEPDDAGDTGEPDDTGDTGDTDVECTGDGDCDDGYCASNECVECITDEHCDDDEECNDTVCECAEECCADSDCASACDVCDDNTCVQDCYDEDQGEGICCEDCAGNFGGCAWPADMSCVTAMCPTDPCNPEPDSCEAMCPC